ncbi:MAG TPA: phytoene/squalene synthase family protein [Solirubrobacteraceae bacterium]
MTTQQRTSTPGVRPGPASPGARSQAPPSADDARALAADSSTFAPAMALLPAPIRADVACLYRVLRTLDDLVDEDDPRALERVRAVERWALGQESDTPETRALAGLAARHPLARGSLVEFCEGMRHDIARGSVETDADFMRYCQRAGGSVGVVLATILGTRNPEGEARMATLGQAMQVTNILRDIDEDRAHGRVYISRAAIERFGFPSPGAREELMRDHIARADALYEEGLRAIPLLREGRRAMALAAVLYREILREIEREGYGTRPGRVVVAPWRRKALSVRCRMRPS